MNYQKLYTRCFNAITDIIQMHETQLEELKKLQQELEDEYVSYETTLKPFSSQSKSKNGKKSKSGL